MGSSRPTIAARRADTNRGYKKASHRVSMEAVRNALLETRREASAVALPLPSAVQLETSHISIDDRFAAQIDLSLGFGWRRGWNPRPNFAHDFGGTLPAYNPFTEFSSFLSCRSAEFL